ncbi:hypothetical protein P0F65_13940 [Sphingomonas sp. I4]
MAPVLVMAIGLALTGCSPLKTFDALVPKDGGAARVASAIPYGSGPRRMLDVYAPRKPGLALARTVPSSCSSMAAAGTAGRAPAMPLSGGPWRRVASWW